MLFLEGVNEIYIKIDKYSGADNICKFLIGCYNRTEFTYQNDFGEYYTSVEMKKLNLPELPFQFIVIEDGSVGDFNVRKQGYEYLKTLPEFAGCEDC